MKKGLTKLAVIVIAFGLMSFTPHHFPKCFDWGSLTWQEFNGVLAVSTLVM